MQFGHLKRREFITLLGSAAAWPRVARGQCKPAISGVLGSGSAQSSAFLIDALKEGMNENGLAEGRDYVLDVRWAEGDYKRDTALASESAGSRYVFRCLYAGHERPRLQRGKESGRRVALCGRRLQAPHRLRDRVGGDELAGHCDLWHGRRARVAGD